jgi:RNase P subunit RPR2
MEKISWTDRVRNEEVLQRERVREEKNVLQTIKIRKDNSISRISCRNCFLKHVIEEKIEGRIEVTGRKEEELSSY